MRTFKQKLADAINGWKGYMVDVSYEDLADSQEKLLASMKNQLTTAQAAIKIEADQANQFRMEAQVAKSQVADLQRQLRECQEKSPA